MPSEDVIRAELPGQQASPSSSSEVRSANRINAGCGILYRALGISDSHLRHENVNATCNPIDRGFTSEGLECTYRIRLAGGAGPESMVHVAGVDFYFRHAALRHT